HAPREVTKVVNDPAAGEVRLELWVARQIADDLLALDRLTPHVVSADGRAAAGGMEQAHQDADGRRLACAIRTQEAKDLAFVHIARDMFNAAGTPIKFRQVVDRDDCRHACLLLNTRS